MTRLLVFSIAVAGCFSAQTEAPPQSHPLSQEFYLPGVLPDGRINPEWGFGQPDARPVPDTLEAPRRSLLSLLHGEPLQTTDTLRANVLAEVAGFILCPPCPPDALCEPCAQDAVVLKQEVDGGRVLGWFELPHPRSDNGLRARQRVVATVEIVQRDGQNEQRLLGLTAN